MKKVFLLLIFLCLMMLDFKNNKNEMVFNEIQKDYNLYELVINEKYINTNNFYQLFKEDKIVSIEPFLNINYQDKINNIKYTFERVSLESNLERFKKRYINKLNQLGYKKDTLSVNINGIYIRRIVLYTNEDKLKSLQLTFDCSYMNLY